MASDSASSTSDSSSSSHLIAAERGDFYEGSEIYVRGKKGVCTRYDEPHVYWRFDGSDVEKHRSFAATPHIFKIDGSHRQIRRKEHSNTPVPDDNDEGDNHQANENNHGHNAHERHEEEDGSSQAPSLGDPEHSTQNHRDENPHSSMQQHTPINPHDSPAPAPSPHPRRAPFQASFLNAFASRAQPMLVNNVHGNDSHAADYAANAETRTVEARALQAVTIEKCSAMKFVIPVKVAALSLIGLTDTTVEFLSSVSKVEIIRCKRTLVKVTDPFASASASSASSASGSASTSASSAAELTNSAGSGTYSIDESEDVKIIFPSPADENQKIQFISCHSPALILTATLYDENGHANGERKETVPVADAESVAHAQEELKAQHALASATDASAVQQVIREPHQTRTVYQPRSGFLSKLLSREDEKGFFDNR